MGEIMKNPWDRERTEEDIKEIMRRFHTTREDAETAPLAVLYVFPKGFWQYYMYFQKASLINHCRCQKKI